jgi:hypothetical protein
VSAGNSVKSAAERLASSRELLDLQPPIRADLDSRVGPKGGEALGVPGRPYAMRGDPSTTRLRERTNKQLRVFLQDRILRNFHRSTNYAILRHLHGVQKSG